jgi:hypothetical protein
MIAVNDIVSGIEMKLGDVCEGLDAKQSWEECFHLAHDWLIDNRHYTPERNETLALATADKLFPNTQEKENE